MMLLAVSIVGATVMPHVVYLHSALTATRTRYRSDGERARALRYERWDVIAALGLAGLVNLAMLLIAAKAFHSGTRRSGAVSIIRAHAGLADLAGGERRWPSPSRCSPRVSLPPASARSRVRWSWKAS
jgi:manganese transport protein